MTSSQVRDTGWFKCTRSGGGNEMCVEVRITATAVGVRDSKNQAGPSVAVTNGSWNRFLTAIKDQRIE